MVAPVDDADEGGVSGVLVDVQVLDCTGPSNDLPASSVDREGIPFQRSLPPAIIGGVLVDVQVLDYTGPSNDFTASPSDRGPVPREKPLPQARKRRARLPSQSIDVAGSSMASPPRQRKSRRRMLTETPPHQRTSSQVFPDGTLPQPSPPPARKRRARTQAREGSPIDISAQAPPRQRNTRRVLPAKASPQQPPLPAKQRRRRDDRIPDAVGGKPIPREPRKLKPPTNCTKCGARKFEYETKGFCCCNGEVKLASNEYPAELVRLFTSNC